MKKQSASSRSAARGTTKKTATSAKRAIAADELDRRFDAGEDISAHLDWSKARRPGRDVQRVNVDFPVGLLAAIDREADRLGVTRQAFIKVRMADALATERIDFSDLPESSDEQLASMRRRGAPKEE